jgi:chemotaxis signal transduction protein
MKPFPLNLSDDADFSSLLDSLDDTAASVFSEGAPPAGGEKYVVFGLNAELYAVHSSLVAEVLSPLPITPLPGVPSWLAGVINLRGEIICVADLRKFWQKSPSGRSGGGGGGDESQAKNKFIVLRSLKTEMTVAFLVERFYEIVSLAPQDIKFSAADFENAFPTLFGKAAHKAGTLHLFDAENLLSSLTLIELRT